MPEFAAYVAAHLGIASQADALATQLEVKDPYLINHDTLCSIYCIIRNPHGQFLLLLDDVIIISLWDLTTSTSCGGP